MLNLTIGFLMVCLFNVGLCLVGPALACDHVLEGSRLPCFDWFVKDVLSALACDHVLECSWLPCFDWFVLEGS